MDNIYDMKTQDIHDRAHQKVWSKIMNCNISILSCRNDIKNRSFGSLNQETVEMMLESNERDQKVWSYILTLIETNDKD